MKVRVFFVCLLFFVFVVWCNCSNGQIKELFGTSWHPRIVLKDIRRSLQPRFMAEPEHYKDSTKNLENTTAVPEFKSFQNPNPAHYPGIDLDNQLFEQKSNQKLDSYTYLTQRGGNAKS